MNELDIVIATLKRGTSQVPEILKPAEQQLKSWERQPNFCLSLAKISTDFNNEISIRWLAVMCLKNNIEKFWRNSFLNKVAPKEKFQICETLLQNYNEPVPQIASQLAVLISRIYRMEFPKSWKKLIPTLIERTKSTDELVQQRALLILYQVIKQISTLKEPSDRNGFQEVSTQIIGYLFDLWIMKTDLFLMYSSSDSIILAHLCLKSLRKIVVYGYINPHHYKEVNTCINRLYERIKTIMQFRKDKESDNCLCLLLEKHIVLITKILIDFQEMHPYSYFEFLRPSLELSYYYIFTVEGEQFIFDRFIIQCIKLMTSIIMCRKYKPSKIITAKSKMPEFDEAVKIRSEFFTKEVCEKICATLISKYFLITKADLELWDDDPECFYFEDDSVDSGNYSLRKCSVLLFKYIFHENKKELTPLLVTTVRHSSSIVSADNFEAICRKDALYKAIGIVSFDLYDCIDFDEWFNQTLIIELTQKEPNFRILRRRIIWLISEWCNVKFNSENRPMLYQIVNELLSPNEDLVVRISTSQALKIIIDSFEFDSEQFTPYLSSTFGLLFDLLKKTKECNTKMKVLHVMSFMIEILGVAIQSHCNPLIQYLPLLWDESVNHDMLRCAILTTLTNLVHGLLDESVQLHDFLLPVIKFSTNIEDSCHVYLLEDGLLLWLAVIENCVDLSKGMVEIISNIFPILDCAKENLRTCLKIISAYILMAPENVITRYGETIVQQANCQLKDLKTESYITLMNSLEMMMRVAPRETAQLLRTVFPDMISQLVKEEQRNSNTCGIQICFLARLVLYSEDIFVWTINEAATKLKLTAEETLQKLIYKWSRDLYYIIPEERRKLCAIGLTHLCRNANPPVIAVWGHAIASITEVVHNLTVGNSDQDKLVITSSGMNSPTKKQSVYNERLNICNRSDPTYTTSLRAYLRQTIKEFEQHVQPDLLSEIFDSLDLECKKFLQSIC